MHEMSLVRSLVDIVLDECAGKNVKAVRAVHLSIGELGDVIEEQIPDFFRHFTRGTIAENAEIVVTRVPAYVTCNECSEIFRIDVRDSSTWECPRCHAHRKYRLFSGREFRVDGIDVEFAAIEDNDKKERNAL